MVNELWLDKLNSGEETIESYLEGLRDYLFDGELLSRRKNEICAVHQGKHKEEFKLGQMLVSAYFMSILEAASIKLQLEYFFKGTESKDLPVYIDEISRIYLEKNSDMNYLKASLASVIASLSDDMLIVNGIHGQTVSLYDICRLRRENEEFKALTDYKIPEGLELHDITLQVEEKVDRCMEILKTEDSCFKDLIAGGAINKRQLGQSIVNVGLKPDLDGNVIPDPVNTSFVRGLRDSKDFYISAMGGRKALITNYKGVKVSGYLTRKLQLSSIKIDLSDEECCDTVHTISYTIDSNQMFDRLLGRVMSNGHVISNTDRDEFVNGKKTVNIYSPITCNGKRGICKRCYGKLSKFVEKYSIGTIAVLLLTDKLTQTLLSAKHLLTAKTTKIEWSEDFMDAFHIDKSGIFVNPETTKVIVDPQDMSEDEDDESYVNSVTCKVGTKTVEIFSPKKLFLTNQADVEALQLASEPIALHIDYESPLFAIKVKNIELNSTLMKLIDLLQKSDHCGCGNDYNAVANRFMDYITESNFKFDAVHAEVIVACLMSSATGERPDFSKPEVKGVIIKDIKDSILNDESLSISLAFEQIRKQLNSPETYEKHKKGEFDSLFV